MALNVTPTNLTQWLKECGLGQYGQAFADNGIDFDVLPHLSDDDLEKLGLNLGDRRRLQLALESLPNDAHQADAQPGRDGAHPRGHGKMHLLRAAH